MELSDRVEQTKIQVKLCFNLNFRKSLVRRESKRSLWNAAKDKSGGTDFESARDIQAVLNRFRAIGEIRVQTKTSFFPKCQTFEKFAHLYSQMLAPLRCQYKSLTKHSKHTTIDLNGSFRMCQKFPERCQIGLRSLTAATAPSFWKLRLVQAHGLHRCSQKPRRSILDGFRLQDLYLM